MGGAGHRACIGLDWPSVQLLRWPSAGLLLNSHDQHNLTGMVANVLDPTVMEIRETVRELIKTSS